MTPRFTNPFLPSYEYIPDGEPKIFGSRVYLYGSHDRFNGSTFCMNDYVCWSAPMTDLSDWKFEGTIYRQSQHPHRGLLPIDRCFAPDVAQGPDGRYYLYYGYSFTGRLYVAVSHRPTGPFEYLDEIHYANGTPLGHGTDPMGFDPGVFIDTDGTVYLYYGFGAEHFPFLRLYGQHTQAKGAYVVVLSSDMVTIQQGPLSLGIPLASQSLGTSFEQHAFFEASSMRRYGDTYYFIYSSTQGHELCYATSTSPLGPFTYGGVLVSNGDIGLEGWSTTTQAGNYTGNNHGSLLHCEGQDYIFYHRHTNRHAFSRQACVERVMRTADGHFIQAERTSSGASMFPLPGYGIYDAHIACHLIGPTGTRFYGVWKYHKSKEPYLTQTGRDRHHTPTQYIRRITEGTVIGYRYFNLSKTHTIMVMVSGWCRGILLIRYEREGPLVGAIPIENHSRYLHHFKATVPNGSTRSALYFEYRGAGSMNLHQFHLS